ncbi:hypothetical protein DQ04_24951000, partial [Trypanosoma grayi]|uniref:hypothetical protein n=1 Tax=Trypanosoma grayi TaxID=71804 RepID=UPI0004F3F4D5
CSVAAITIVILLIFPCLIVVTIAVVLLLLESVDTLTQHLSCPLQFALEVQQYVLQVQVALRQLRSRRFRHVRPPHDPLKKRPGRHKNVNTNEHQAMKSQAN